jgi:hypothetical protein
MKISRNDAAGGALALCTLALVAWLATEGQALAACQKTLRVADFATENPAAGEAVGDLLRRRAIGTLTAAELRCVARIGFPGEASAAP